MTSPAPELSSIEASLEDLIQRIGAIAQRLDAARHGDALAGELFTIEGNLRTGHRRLSKLIARL